MSPRVARATCRFGLRDTQSLELLTRGLRGSSYNGCLQAQLLVFDEIHYLRDTERGVVWEESIVLAPKTARFAFLSATIPNAQEFTQWIAKTHRWACTQQWEVLRLLQPRAQL